MFPFSSCAFASVNNTCPTCASPLFATIITPSGRFNALLLLSTHIFVTGILVFSSGTVNVFVIVFVSSSMLDT